MRSAKRRRVATVRNWLAVMTSAMVLLGVSGCGDDGESSAEVTKKEAAAVEIYRGYLLESSEKLTTWTSQLRHKVKLGIIGGAQSRYASSSIPFGRLTPALDFFPKLDQRLDAPRAGAFPRVERLLWQGEIGSKLARLVNEVFDLNFWFHEEIKTRKLLPATILANARHTLDSIAASDLQLEATPYMKLDTMSASAKLEGVEAAYKAVRPAVLSEDPDLAESLNKEFAAAFVELEEFGVPAKKLDQVRPSSPGTSFINSASLTAEDLKPLTGSIHRLQTYFDQAASALSGT